MADHYIYTLMARDLVRGLDRGGEKSVQQRAAAGCRFLSQALANEKLIHGLNFAKNHTLDYWESGMDLGLSWTCSTASCSTSNGWPINFFK